MSSFIARNLTEIEAVAGCTFACISNTVFRMFSCLQINCQPFYLRQLLKFHPFDWIIEIYLQTEGQGTHHKMVTLQPMPGFSPLFKGLAIDRFSRIELPVVSVWATFAITLLASGITTTMACLSINWIAQTNMVVIIVVRFIVFFR